MYDEIDALELEKIIDSKSNIEIIDVREKYEWDIIKIPKAKLIPLSSIQTRLWEIDFSKDVYIFCRTWARSWQVCAWLEYRGKKATNVSWSIKQLYNNNSKLIEVSSNFDSSYF